MRIAKVIACLSVIVSCGLIMMKGAEFLAFARVSEAFDSFSADIRAGQAPDPEQIAAFDNDLQAWSQVWGLRSEARTRLAELRLVSVASLSLDLVERDIVAVLSVDPLNGHLWMKLAIAHLLSGKSLEAILAAFDMAALTNPLEANVLYERVEFGFAFWDILPADRHDRVAADFVALRKQMDVAGLGGREAGWLGFIIASKSESIPR